MSPTCHATSVLVATRCLLRAACLCIGLFASMGLALEPIAVDNGYIRKNFTVEDGLLSNQVNAILQTRDGFLWIGTELGLLRFDGQHFAPVTFLPKAVPVFVGSLAEAPDGALWVGTRAGVARIPRDGMSEPGHTVATVYHPGSGDGDSIQCLLFSRSGVLFVGTMTGMYRFEDGKFSVIIPDLWTSRIEEASNGNLLVITSKGFMEWDGSRVLARTEVSARLGVGQNEIFHVSEDQAGTTWYCSVKGVARQRGRSIEALQPADAVFRVKEDAEGTVWFSQSGALYRATKSGRELVASNLSASYLAFDKDGDVWAGTKGAGLFRLKRQAVKMFTAADGLPLGSPTSVLATRDGKLWVGSECGGLSWFDGRRFHTYSERDGLTNSCVFSLAEDRNGDILIGTFGGGIFRLREGRFTVLVKEDKLKDNVAVAILPASDGSLWVVYSDGPHRILDGYERTFTTADGLSSNSVLSAYADRRGTIWVETTAGIDRLENERFVPVSTTDNASVGPGQLGFGEDQRGELFAFGPLSGIMHVRETRVSRLDVAPKITGMLRSREALWFCGDGIYRTAPDSLEKWEQRPADPPDYTRFDRADGMNTAQCNGGFRNMAATSDGKVWVATEQGLAMLPSSMPPQSSAKLAIYMRRVVIGKTPQPAGRELVVAPGARHIELHFGAIELASPERVRFQYRLDGVDRDWLDADAGQKAIYTLLPIGSHAFHVRACNADGVWDRSGIVYTITQQPYFYQTAWFAVACGAAIVAVLFAGHRFRMRYVTAIIQERLEERASERVRIARDLHDTLLQGTQGLMLRFHVAAEQIPEGHSARSMIGDALNVADRVIDEARMRVRGLRSESLDDSDLTTALAQVGSELNVDNQVRFSVSSEGSASGLHPIIRDELYFIGREAISNAFRHAGASEIEVELIFQKKAVCLRCRDNGRGMDPGVIRQGKAGHWGVRGMQERAEKLGAKLECWGSPGQGTELSVTVLVAPWKRRVLPSTVASR